MKVTVLWEDNPGVELKGFGPHRLLVACVADRLGRGRDDIKGLLVSRAKGGVGNIINALKKDLTKLTKIGPVFAVIDRDKVREIWKPAPLPADCMAAIRNRIEAEVESSEFDLIFLVQNMESLVDACDKEARAKLGGRKPKPDERDRILARPTWEATGVQRQNILKACPSFERLVDRVGCALSPTLRRVGCQ